MKGCFLSTLEYSIRRRTRTATALLCRIITVTRNDNRVSRATLVRRVTIASLLVLLFSFAAGAWSANSVGADTPTANSSLAPIFRWQKVDAARPENWPKGNWQPIKASELRAAMRPQPPVARVLSATYSARYAAGQLSEGRLRFELRNEIAPRPVAVSLEPIDLPILSPRWVSDRPLVLGTNPDGETNVLLTQPQDVLEAGFLARGEPRGSAVEVHVSLAPATRSTLQLLVPRGQRLVTDVGTETVSEIPGQSDHRQWTVHVSGQPDIRLLFVPESAIDAIDKIPPVVLQELSYVIRRGTARVDAAFNIDLHSSTLNALTFDLTGPDVELIAVQLGDRPLTGWTLQPSGNQKQLIVPLPEPLSHALPRLSLQFTAAIDVAGPVALPTLRLKDSFVQDGQAVLRLPTPGIVSDIHYPGYRYQDQSRSAVEGLVVVLKQARPDASVVVTLADGLAELRLKSLSQIRQTETGLELDAVVEWTASRGGEFEATAVVPSGWDVTSVANWPETAAGDLGSWDVSPSPEGRRIRIQFRNALDPERSRMVRVLAKATAPVDLVVRPSGLITAAAPARTIFTAVASSVPAVARRPASSSSLPAAIDSAFTGREWLPIRAGIAKDVDWQYADETDLPDAKQFLIESAATRRNNAPASENSTELQRTATGRSDPSDNPNADATQPNNLLPPQLSSPDAEPNRDSASPSATPAQATIADVLAAHCQVRVGSLDDRSVQTNLRVQLAAHRSQLPQDGVTGVSRQSLDLVLPVGIEKLIARSTSGLVEIENLGEGNYRFEFPAAWKSSTLEIEYAQTLSNAAMAAWFARRMVVPMPTLKQTAEVERRPSCFSISLAQPPGSRTWISDASEWSGDESISQSDRRWFGILAADDLAKGNHGQTVKTDSPAGNVPAGVLSAWADAASENPSKFGEANPCVAFRPVDRLPQTVSLFIVDSQAWWCACLMMWGIAVLGILTMRRLARFVRASMITASMFLLMSLVLFSPPLVAELSGSMLAGCVLGLLIPATALTGRSARDRQDPGVPTGSTHAFSWSASTGKSTSLRPPQPASVIPVIASTTALFACFSAAAVASTMQLDGSASAPAQAGPVVAAFGFAEIETVLVPGVASSAQENASSNDTESGAGNQQIDDSSLLYVSPAVAAWAAARSESAFSPPAWLIRSARYVVSCTMQPVSMSKTLRNVLVTAEFELQVRRAASPTVVEFPWTGSNLQDDTACTVDGKIALAEVSTDGKRLIVHLPPPEKIAVETPPLVSGPQQQSEIEPGTETESSNSESRTFPGDRSGQPTPATVQDAAAIAGLYDRRLLTLRVVAANGSDAIGTDVRANLTTPKVLVGSVDFVKSTVTPDEKTVEFWSVGQSETPARRLQAINDNSVLLGATTDWLITTVSPNRTLPLIEPDLDSAVLVDLTGENTLFRQRLRTVVADGNRRRLVFTTPRGAVLLSGSCARTAVRSLQVATETDWETVLYFASPLQRGDVIDLVWAWTTPSDQLLTVPGSLLIPRQPDFGSIPPRWAWIAVKHATDIRCDLSANNPERFRQRTPAEFAAVWGSEALVGLQSAATVEHSTDLLIRRSHVAGRLELQSPTLTLDVQSRNVLLTYSTVLQPVATATFPIRIEVPAELMVETVGLSEKEVPSPARWSQVGRQIVLFPDERLSRPATLKLVGSLRSKEGEFEELPLIRIADSSPQETTFRLRTSPGSTADVPELDLRPEKIDTAAKTPSPSTTSNSQTQMEYSISATATIPATSTTLKWKRQQRQLVPDAYLLISPDTPGRRWIADVVFETVEPAAWPNEVGFSISTALPVELHSIEGANAESRAEDAGVSAWQIRASRTPLQSRRISFRWPMNEPDSPKLPEIRISGVKSFQLWFLPLESGLSGGTGFVERPLPPLAFLSTASRTQGQRAFLYSAPTMRVPAVSAVPKPANGLQDGFALPTIDLVASHRKPEVRLQAIVRSAALTEPTSASSLNGVQSHDGQKLCWCAWKFVSPDRSLLAIDATAAEIAAISLNGIRQPISMDERGKALIAADASTDAQWLEVHWRDASRERTSVPTLSGVDVAIDSTPHPLVIWNCQTSSRFQPGSSIDSKSRSHSEPSRNMTPIPELMQPSNDSARSRVGSTINSYSPQLWTELISAVSSFRQGSHPAALPGTAFSTAMATNSTDGVPIHAAVTDWQKPTGNLSVWMKSNSDPVLDTPTTRWQRLATPLIGGGIALLAAAVVWCLEAAGVLSQLRSRDFAAWGSIAVWWAWWLTPTAFACVPLFCAVVQGFRQWRNERRKSPGDEWPGQPGNRFLVTESRLSHQ